MHSAKLHPQLESDRLFSTKFFTHNLIWKKRKLAEKTCAPGLLNFALPYDWELSALKAGMRNRGLL